MAKGDYKEFAKTPVGRFNFEHLVTPRKKKTTDANGNAVEKDQWQVCVTFGPETDLEPLKAVARDVAQQAFGANWKKLVQQGSIKWPFRDGGEINPNTDEPRFGEDVIYINASSNNPVQIVSRYRDPKTGKPRLLYNGKGEKVAPDAEDLIYAGVYGRLSVTVASFNHESRGVTFYVNNAQTMEYGERLSSGESAEDAFDDEDSESLPEAEAPDSGEDTEASDLL